MENALGKKREVMEAREHRAIHVPPGEGKVLWFVSDLVTFKTVGSCRRTRSVGFGAHTPNQLLRHQERRSDSGGVSSPWPLGSEGLTGDSGDTWGGA